MRVAETPVFKFDELSDRAKEKARDWFRSCSTSDDFDFVLEDADQCARLLGIDIDRKPVKLMGGGTRYDPTIWFSGFSSQGDGACFEGRYSYAKGASKAIKKHAPRDVTLHAIADQLQAIQRKAFYRLEARMSHSGRYYHAYSMAVDVTDAESGNDAPSDVAESITELMRDFANWIYRQLEQEYEYRNSDEAVDENIRCNEYEFTEDGSIY